MFESTSICLSLTQQFYCLRDSERQLGMQVHNIHWHKMHFKLEYYTAG